MGKDAKVGFVMLFVFALGLLVTCTVMAVQRDNAIHSNELLNAQMDVLQSNYDKLSSPDMGDGELPLSDRITDFMNNLVSADGTVPFAITVELHVYEDSEYDSADITIIIPSGYKLEGNQ